jgi:hypothetical protein
MLLTNLKPLKLKKKYQDLPNFDTFCCFMTKLEGPWQAMAALGKPSVTQD